VFHNFYKRIKIIAEEKNITSNKELFSFFLKYFFHNYFFCEIASHLPNNLVPSIHKLRGVKIGRDVYIDRTAYLDNLYPELISIEDGVRITAHCVLVSHVSPSMEMKAKFLPFSKKGIVIKKHAFIGVSSVILPGVTIGEYAVVGAGSVVIKDVPPMTLVCGNPAKVARKLSCLANQC